MCQVRCCHQREALLTVRDIRKESEEVVIAEILNGVMSHRVLF